MSTRICKSIGAFIPLDKAHHILVADASPRLEAYLDETPELLLSGFAKFVKQHAPRLPVSDTSRSVLNALARLYEQEEVQAEQLVSGVMFYDAHAGFLFRNKGNVRASRVGNEIDYFENRDNLNAKVVPTSGAIHPGGGYRYTGPVDSELTELLDDNTRLTPENGFFVACLLNSRVGDKYELLTEQHRCFAESGLFLPETDPMMYLFALKMGLLKPGITLTQFEDYARPSILTYWT